MAGPLAFLGTPGGQAATGFVLSGISSFFGRKSANKQKKDEDKFYQEKYDKFDYPGWQMQGQRLVANRDEKIRAIQLAARNELKLAEF